MKSTTRAAVVLAVVALLSAPAIVVAASSSTILYSSGVTLGSRVTCTHTAITGPTGKVTVIVYALKHKHPARAALSCGRAAAVARAFKADFYGQLLKKAGAKKTVDGTRYELEKFVSPGASGFAPAMVGAQTAVIASYASSR